MKKIIALLMLMASVLLVSCSDTSVEVEEDASVETEESTDAGLEVEVESETTVQ